MANKNYEQRLYSLLDEVSRQGASDIHLSAGQPPNLRIDGSLVPVKKEQVLTPEDTRGITEAILREDKDIKTLEEERAVDLSYSYKSIARFRVNIFYQFGTLAIAMRLIPAKIRTVEELGLPQILHKFTQYQQGLVLVTGPTGHGKSTSLAALVDEINHERAEHIITIEDPIEYIFTQNRSIINQREIGRDAIDFHSSLRSAFRQDPDIIMVGEMRDPETIATAITAAETGHLIFATLHTNNAAQSIDRIIDSFPAGQQSQIRSQLALTLVGVVAQRLLPRVDGGRVPAVEVLIANAAVRNLIREDKLHEIGLVIETGSEDGMISMNKYLANLVNSGEISMTTAESYSINVKELRMLVNK